MSENKIAVVTGANKGLGFAVCQALGKRGYEVVVTARNEEAGNAAVEKLISEGISAKFCQLDVTSDSQVEEFRKFFETNYSGIDVLVNNAGVFLDPPSAGGPLGTGPLCKLADIDTISKNFDVNTLGVLRVSKALIPFMRKGARIVNVSSGMGALNEMGGGSPAYRISKAALNAVTRMLSVELEADGIKVNSVCPGWVKTDMGGSQANRTTEEGAASIVWAAELDNSGPTGGFYRDGTKIPW